MKAVEFEGPVVPSPYRVLLLGAATSGWYEAEDDERRKRILPRFQAMMDEWRSLGARVLATFDDDRADPCKRADSCLRDLRQQLPLDDMKATRRVHRGCSQTGAERVRVGRAASERSGLCRP